MYPVTIRIEPAFAHRNRLTTVFRLILAIPHVILVGGVGVGLALSGDSRTTLSSEGGLLGAVAVFLAIVSWFTMPDNKRAHTVYDRVGGTAETLLEYELEL